MLDHGQYGYLASRTAILHADGGQWTLSRAIGEASPQLEAKEREQGISFGDLVRERRRQHGLPDEVADKFLRFRAGHCRCPLKTLRLAKPGPLTAWPSSSLSHWRCQDPARMSSQFIPDAPLVYDAQICGCEQRSKVRATENATYVRDAKLKA